jgi:murein DD-endopeptidase MepM/ murein hydrolase activator NlpD
MKLLQRGQGNSPRRRKGSKAFLSGRRPYKQGKGFLQATFGFTRGETLYLRVIVGKDFGSGQRRNYLPLQMVLSIGLVLILAACSLGSAESGEPTATSEKRSSDSQPLTAASSPAPTLPSTLAPTSAPALPSPSSPTPTITLPPCDDEVCVYPGHFLLARPIAPTGVDVVDPTYRYGATQSGQRKTHHGVEFVNPQGTPVLAAADGTVIVAGNDHQTPYADFPVFYGNLVIIEHALPGIEQPVFTVYGHLSEVRAEVDQQVKMGDPIGLVGFTGAAIGEHLHFEVRLGKNSYRKTRNPELWLQPHSSENGQAYGAIAGRVVDEFGDQIYIPTVTIERVDPAGSEPIAIHYLEGYADWTVNGDDQWGEVFALGDLPPGKYSVSFVARGLQTYQVDVLPGMVTLVTFDAGGGE